ncbi:hypothetical protein FRC01_010253 [Tulasnella sp. 417]|nr:hypothetical protein FRC01_010253 [Tulasnella sp. 417]
MGRKRTITNVVDEANVAANVTSQDAERPPKRTRGRQTTKLPTFSATVSPPVVVATPSTRRSARIKVAQPSASAYVNAFGNDDSELSDDDLPTSGSVGLTDRPMSDSDEEEVAKQKRASPKKKKSTTAKPPKRKRKQDVATGTEGGAADVSEGEATQEKKAKTPRKRKPKDTEPVVYDIPDVEKKKTTFKEKGMEFVYELGLQNIRDLVKLIEWNEKNKIHFMRMSSEIFPFASHAVYGYDLSFADKELKEAGELAKKYKHRLTMHPGQFTQLGSPKEEVVTASVRELEYQCEIMDRMGLDQDSVMIIHMGGVYGDKVSSLARFKENYTTKLSDSIKARLVLENDELCYNLDDIMPVCDELNIPIVVDYHHDWIYPSERPVAELIPIINKTWKRKGIRVKQHLSEPRPGAVTVMEKRAHADRCKSLPEGLPDDVDLMIEAKDKEQAVLELYRIYDLEEVIWENLRPPKKEQTLATNGRKSAKARSVGLIQCRGTITLTFCGRLPDFFRAKKTGVTGADGTEVVLKDVEKEGEEAVVVDAHGAVENADQAAPSGSAMGPDREDAEMARGCPSDEE